ncbi:hypothetical protein ACHHYP_11097 [Achlya hypogyna]|uniref:Secreted protein n=1 Tax=Achlya hypogyna TaxID=1202772 RepID=A0A0A7CP39_ACHHY|nr:secreted protein [Achlya hypogyna]OQR86005.1 hypothetical protein ACHHYP_11097 [Achlya hypogyna]
MVSITRLLRLSLAAATVAGAPQGFFQDLISDIRHGIAETLFGLEQLVAAEPVVGFCSPEAIRAFDELIAAGALQRQSAYRKGVQNLVGSTTLTLDGPAFAARQAALLAALSPAAVQTYAPTIRAIVQADHATWAARGGLFSLADAARTMTFKVFVAVVLGLESPERYTGYRAQLDDYLSYLRVTASVAPPEAVAIRKRLLDTLVRPAITAARARSTPKPSVVDSLVAMGSVAEADLADEIFALLANGLPGLEGLVVHTLTTMASVEGVVANLATARDVYLAKYPGAARWQHLDELGYANQFLLEVQRTYGAKPSHAFARATKELSVAGAKVPKNRLTAVLLECLNQDPGRWPEPGRFDPSRFAIANTSAYAFAPFAMNLLTDRPHGMREALTTTVLQTHVVSLFDFVWSMAPHQNYTVEAGVNAGPVDGLMTVGFRAAPGAVVDTEAWRRLTRPYPEAFNSSLDNPLAADPRLDFLTHSLIQLINTRFNLWVKPSAATAITIPTTQGVLPKRTLYGTTIEIPTVDEDVTIPKALLEAGKLLQDTAPFVDNFDAKWRPGEDMEAYVLSKVGHMWPQVRVHWDDRYSDRALELLVFQGLGQHMVTKLPQPHADGSYYTVALNFMDALEVRAGYAKAGADAFFTSKGKVTKIVRQGVTYVPGDAGWEYAKLCFRGSVNIKITAVDHLIGLHVTAGNYLTTASREQLPPAHPLRRLLKPFTFRAAAINYEASNSLFAPKSVLHRAFAFSEKGMAQAWAAAQSMIRLETFPQHIARQGVDSLSLPFHEDGLAYWDIVHSFASDYLGLYFPSDAAVTGDASVVAFWKALAAVTPLPALSRTALVDATATAIFLVTAMHNHLGGIAEYASDPAFCPTAWVEGELAGRPGTSVRSAIIMAGTGYLQPNVMEDFTHVLLDDKAKAVARRFTAALRSLVGVVQSRNAKRVLPYRGFDPEIIDMAIGI